jgi:hypothetical protein
MNMNMRMDLIIGGNRTVLLHLRNGRLFPLKKENFHDQGLIFDPFYDATP